jgi:ribosome-binding factor A
VSRRVERISSLVRTLLAEAIQTRLNDPRIPPVTSITRVEVSADLSVARVFVSVLAPEPRQELCLRALRSSASHLRWLLGQELELRKTPVLDFHLDQSLKRGFETCQIIERLVPPLAAEPDDDPSATADDDADVADDDSPADAAQPADAERADPRRAGPQEDA